MADRKITDMSALAAGSQATGDLIAVVDVSEGAAVNKNKKMTMENLFKGIPGNVGIGASSPSSILTVQASGTQQSLFSARANGGSGGGMVLQSDASDDGLLRLYDSAGAVQVQLDTDGGDNYIAKGNVGLGTSSPGRLLQIGEGDTGVGSNVHTIARIEGRAVSGGQQVATLEFNQLTNAPSEFVGASIGIESSAGTRSESELVFNVSQTANTDAIEAMRLTHDGRLGIGTTSPDDELHINSSSNVNLRLTRDTDTGARISGTDSTSPAFIIETISSGTASERARIDSSGRLLVGTSTSVGPDNFLQLVGDVNDEATITCWRSSDDAGAGGINFIKTRGSVASPSVASNNDTLGIIRWHAHDGSTWDGRAAQIEAFADGGVSSGDTPGRLVFSTTADGASSPTERMRIANDGRMRFNCSSDSPHSLNVAGTVISDVGLLLIGADSSTAAVFNRFSSDGEVVRFNRQGADVGSIDVTTSATSYNTSSDYRLKENVVPLTGAAARLNQLQVHRFNFIADPDKTVDGFLAHEAQAVVPECVTGTKDEVDDEGNPVYQGIDQSKLVPLLTAALQEALAEIESLKARVTALEP